MVKEVISADDFDKELKAAGASLVVVDFTASWCGPCKSIAPVFEELAAQNKDVVFLKVDVDNSQEIAIRYQIRSMPTFLFFKSGEKVDSMIGADKQQLREKVKANK